MSVRFACVACVVVTIAGTSTAGLAQGFDLASRPLEGVDDVAVVEELTAPASATMAPPPADQAKAVESKLAARGVRRVPRFADIRIGADLDDEGRYGSYLSALYKYVPRDDVPLTLRTDATIRGDNLSAAAMGTRGLGFEGALRAVVKPQAFDKRLKLALAVSGAYMAAAGVDVSSVGIGGNASVAFCTPGLCRNHDDDGEEFRAGAKFTDRSAGSNSFTLDFAYTWQRAYRAVRLADGSGLARASISAAPLVSLKNTDAGWATSLGLVLGIDLSLHVALSVELGRTLQGGAATAAATQGGLVLSYHPPAT